MNWLFVGEKNLFGGVECGEILHLKSELYLHTLTQQFLNATLIPEQAIALIGSSCELKSCDVVVEGGYLEMAGSSSSQAMRLGLWFRYWAGFRLAPYHGTPHHVALRMLQLAGVNSTDRVVDLGCGDARLLIAAAKHHGAHGYGVELDPKLYEEGAKAVEAEGLTHMVTIEQKDAFLVDLSTASVVTLYLTVKGNSKLYPKLCQQLPAGARVVSFCWPFENLEPSRTRRVDGINLFLYDFNNQRSS